MKNKLLAKLIAMLFLATSISAFADGVGYPSTVPGQIGDEMNGARYLPQTIFVYAAAGEKVSFTIGRGRTFGSPQAGLSIRVYSPNGLVRSLTHPSEATTDVSENIPVTAGTTGIWTITLDSPDRNSSWRYDVNALSSSNVRISGRVYTETLVLSQASTQPVTFSLYYVEKEGYKYTANFKEYNGIDSNIRSDKFGVSNTLNGRCVSTYQSLNELSTNTCDGIYKQFFTPINVTLPSSAPRFNGASTVSEWLNPIPGGDPSVTGLTYSSSNVAATPTAGNFSFALTEYTGNATLLVDVNNNGVYTDAIDRSIPFSAIPGSNTVPFNGLNGAGTAVPCGTSLKARVLIDKIGEIHFTMADVETLGGLTVTRTNGIGFPSSILYWNDTNLPTAGRTSVTSPLDGRAGIPSNTTAGVHGWAYTGNSQWGNIRSIDNWAYRPINVFQEVTFSGPCPVPDLTPTTEIDELNFAEGAARDFVVNVFEILDITTAGQVRFRINKISGFTITYPTASGTSNVFGGTPNQNSNWTFTENASFITVTANAGINIAASGKATLGFRVARNPNVASGTTQNITATIIGGSGGETRIDNNNVVTSISAN